MSMNGFRSYNLADLTYVSDIDEGTLRSRRDADRTRVARS